MLRNRSLKPEDPRLAEALEMIAAGRLQESLDLVRGVLDDVPDLAEAHYQYAFLAGALGFDPEEVEDSLVMALHHDPGHATAAVSLASLFQVRGDAEAAASVLEAAFAANPGAELALALGQNRLMRRRYADAIEALRVAASLSPDSAPVGAMLGLALFEGGFPIDAESTLRESLRLDADCVEALHNLALVRFHAADFVEARLLVERALSLRSNSIPTLSLLGHIERDSGFIEEALRRYDECLRVNSGFDDALINRCYALLLDGQFQRGWAEYASRFRLDVFPPRGLPFPEWGGEDPRGERILVYAEQGLGDEVMFASCLGDLQALGPRIVLECNSRLASLFSRSFHDVEVHGMAKADAPRWAESLKGVRWQVAIGDLPRFFRQREELFTRSVIGYLTADPRRVEEYRGRIREIARGRRAIAFSWRGGDWSTGRARRSLTPEALAALVTRMPALWIAVQQGDSEAEIRSMRALGAEVVAWPEIVDDPDLMAALLRAADEVVCVDNTVAHVSGALGLPARVLICAAPEWRYGLRGQRMLWYQSVRLYRQPRLGDWSSVIEALCEDLHD